MAAAKEKEAKELKEVTFYAWRENIPSSEMIRCSGGERFKDAEGRVVNTGEKHAKFAAGIFRTKDPEIIAALRDLIANGKNDMSEDAEDYHKATLPLEKQSQRALALLKQKDDELTQVRHENSTLREQLEAKAKAAAAKKEPAAA